MNSIAIEFYKYHKTSIKALVVIFCCIFLSGIKTNAQNVSASATLDSTTILIGGQIDLRIEVSQPEGLKVNFPVFNDTITKSIEIVEKGEVDSIKMDNDRIVLSQLYRITSFDSGLHYIPPIKIEVFDGELKNMVDTDPLSLRVVNPFQEVNPEKGMFDIKGVQDSPFKLSEILEYIYWVLGILVVLGLAIWGYLYYKRKHQGDGKVFIKAKPDEPAHIIAIRELDKVKEAKLWENNKIKEFYTSVSNILREYIENRYDIPALEQTSIEILSEIKTSAKIDKEIFDQLNQVLELSDLVKFAKFEPLPDEHALSLMNAYFFIEKTKENLIKSLEEEKDLMLEKEKNSNE
ncbi:hypothetical protein [Plebeiibacterium sediminum]|uniref:Protein BatD n=1 Tax=Plebeiibacterium sediminum TaxID=2992112 RepID=A0AAE3M543_9BACT|nr:hypothetical protein [Plebeiobacterium sediminum]MCW3787044.1 hypothetical protein [Plebeiobacterium sediminum]